MAYVIMYIVVCVALLVKRHITRRSIREKTGYYSDPEGTWGKIILIPLILPFFVWFVYPHDTVRGAMVTETTRTLETETMLMETIVEKQSFLRSSKTFWWGLPLSRAASHSSIRITNKLDSTQVEVDNFFDSENYELKQIIDHEYK